MKEELRYLLSADHLKAYLTSFEIPIAKWGIDGKKTIEELYQELKIGDSFLSIENGVIRCTSPLFIDVIYTNQTSLYHCIEIQNKKGKRRSLPGTFAEKRLSGENILTSIERTFKEEIDKSLPKSGLSLTNHDLVYSNYWEETTEAHSYPGLRNRSSNTLYTLIPQPNQGVPKDFELVEDNGITKYSWEIK